jgi:hypothetical protein
MKPSRCQSLPQNFSGRGFSQNDLAFGGCLDKILLVDILFVVRVRSQSELNFDKWFESAIMYVWLPPLPVESRIELNSLGYVFPPISS